MQGNAIGNLVVCYLQTNQPSIKVGNTIELIGMGPVYNGVYFVKRVTHHMDGGSDYYNFVEALPLESAKPPIIESDARSWRGDPICALVIDNKDPESRGRVKVKFPFNGSNGQPCESDWIHVAGPYAGEAADSTSSLRLMTKFWLGSSKVISTIPLSLDRFGTALTCRLPAPTPMITTRKSFTPAVGIS